MLRTTTLLVLLLISGTLQAQNQIEDWQLVRDTYFKVVVGNDTLSNNFNRLDTAEEFAFDYAKDSAQGAPINIVGANYRFEYQYLEQQEPTTEIDTVYIEADNSHPYLKNVDWTYEDIPDTTAWKLRIYGDSEADMISINTKCVGRQSVDFDGVDLALLGDSFSHTMTFNCNEILTWDITAKTDTMSLEPRKYFIDVALIQTLE